MPKLSVPAPGLGQGESRGERLGQGRARRPQPRLDPAVRVRHDRREALELRGERVQHPRVAAPVALGVGDHLEAERDAGVVQGAGEPLDQGGRALAVQAPVEAHDPRRRRRVGRKLVVPQRHIEAG